jgi:hypothetical protein
VGSKAPTYQAGGGLRGVGRQRLHRALRENLMDKCVQFSIFLVNKPGVLSRIFRELAKAKVNVSALAMMDSMEHGVLRMVVEDATTTRQVLQALNVPVTETDVLTVVLANRPGAAADLCDRLSAAHIHIGYMYCTSGGAGSKTTVVLKVPDIKKAMKVIEGQRSPRKDMKIKLRRPTRTARR